MLANRLPHRHTGNISWLAVKPIGNENLIFVVLAGGSQDVSSLESLGEISKDVSDVEERLGGIGRASDIYGLMSAMEAAMKG